MGNDYNDNAGGNPADNSVDESGAVIVLTRTGALWENQSFIKATNPQEYDCF